MSTVLSPSLTAEPTLKEITREYFSHAELAVFSACRTTKWDEDSREEAISWQGYDYGGLWTGSMWPVRDDDGAIIAEQFYK